MARHISDKIQFAPLFIISFPLLAPHTLLEAQKFNIRFSDPSQITEITDKLRHCIYKKALLQSEVADYLGIQRTTYSAYEQYVRDIYSMKNLEKRAVLYDVPVLSLLDELAKRLGVELHNIKH